MLTPSSTVYSSVTTLFRALHLFNSVVYAFPTDSIFDLFASSQTGLSSVNTEPSDLDFWNGGGDLQSQFDNFAISSTDAGLSSTLDPSSPDLFDSTLSITNDPFQASYGDCDAGAPDSNEMVQEDAFELDSGGLLFARGDLESSVEKQKIFQRQDVTYGDLTTPGPHICPAGKLPACCVIDNQDEVVPDEVTQGTRRLREGCLQWGKFFVTELNMLRMLGIMTTFEIFQLAHTLFPPFVFPFFHF